MSDVYVYIYEVGGQLWYVGHGANYRDRTHLSISRQLDRGETPSNVRPWHYDLQEARKRGTPVVVRRVAEGLTKEKALDLEEHLIATLKPLKNTQHVPSGKKQTTRLLKISCSTCGYVARATGYWVAVGLPTCCCGGAFTRTDDRSGKKPPRQIQRLSDNRTSRHNIGV